MDTFDLLLDLVVLPDGSRSWKDEDELAHACRLGVVSAAERAALDIAREEAVGMVEAHAGPFAPGLDAWRPEGGWAAPVLPAGITGDGDGAADGDGEGAPVAGDAGPAGQRG